MLSNLNRKTRLDGIEKVSVQRMKDFWESKSTEIAKVTGFQSFKTTKIDCFVKSVLVGDKHFNQVELSCGCCLSRFVFRAGHDCFQEEDPGLEWFQEEETERVHLRL